MGYTILGRVQKLQATSLAPPVHKHLALASPRHTNRGGCVCKWACFSGRTHRSAPTNVLGLLGKNRYRGNGVPPHPVGEAFRLPPTNPSHSHPHGGTDHGICTNNVRMQTKRLLLGMEKLSALLTDEVVHEHPALAIPRPTGFIPTTQGLGENRGYCCLGLVRRCLPKRFLQKEKTTPLGWFLIYGGMRML